MVPPISSGRPRRQYSESMKAWYDFLKLAGTGAVLVSGSKTGGLRSASVKDSASSFSARRETSSRMLLAVSTSISANGPLPYSLSRPSTSKRLNSMSRRFDL